MVMEGATNEGATTEISSQGTEGAGQTTPEAAKGETGQVSNTPPGVEGAPPPTYTPNFKYKALKEEKEIPDWARTIVTNADMEKRVKDLFTAADGLEPLKQHREQLIAEKKQIEEQWGPIIQNVQQAVGHLQRKDYDSFFESFGLSEKDILSYALHRIQLRDNPQQMQAAETARQLQLQNSQYEQQLQALSGGYEKMAVQQRSFELDTYLGRPELLSTVQAFDARVGKPGAFREEVIKRGKMYAVMQQDIPVETAVSEVLGLIGHGAGQNSQVQAISQNVTGGAAAGGQPGENGQNQGTKPVLPNIRGTGTSPAKKSFRSVAELREHARAMR